MSNNQLIYEQNIAAMKESAEVSANVIAQLKESSRQSDEVIAQLRATAVESADVIEALQSDVSQLHAAMQVCRPWICDYC